MKRIAAAIMLGRPSGLFPGPVPAYIMRLFFSFFLACLFVAEILRVYFLMPYPGSQTRETIACAYWLDQSIFWIRILGLSLLSIALVRAFNAGRKKEKWLLTGILVVYAIVFYCFNFRLQAQNIFHQPVNKSFTLASRSEMERSKLVIGVVIDGKAKAYPIQLIGYHHQVVDTVGNTPVMVTYCTVCRSGRVYSPVVNGRVETFRLVGMDHFNAVFEDASTKSWWQQATGMAITGPLKGSSLKEFRSAQVTLGAWLRDHPNSLVMDPDTLFMNNYFKLEDYDQGTMRSNLVRRDTASWQPKSWVVGVTNNLFSKAYDWNDLLRKKIIQDSVNTMPVVLAMENDSASFHVYDRRLNNLVLHFHLADSSRLLVDENTGSGWNMDGLCVEGKLKGERLLAVQAYNEFWHSWQTFRKSPDIYVVSNRK